MTKSIFTALGLFALILGVSFLTPSLSNAANKAIIGETAPDFSVLTTSGETFTLSEYKDKIVILEWTNHQCPFVRKHYDSNNMQDLQKELTDKGAVWVSIVSSAKGKQGHITPGEANAITTDESAAPSFKILDESGEIGKLFGAKTTPHMYVINAGGALAYNGAIDDDSSPYADRAKGANNYIRAAFNDLTNGNDVQVAETRPYGCSVKY